MMNRTRVLASADSPRHLDVRRVVRRRRVRSAARGRYATDAAGVESGPSGLATTPFGSDRWSASVSLVRSRSRASRRSRGRRGRARIQLPPACDDRRRRHRLQSARGRPAVFPLSRDVLRQPPRRPPVARRVDDAHGRSGRAQSMTASTWFLNPSIGFLYRFQEGLTIGVDAGSRSRSRPSSSVRVSAPARPPPPASTTPLHPSPAPSAIRSRRRSTCSVSASSGSPTRADSVPRQIA